MLVSPDGCIKRSNPLTGKRCNDNCHGSRSTACLCNTVPILIPCAISLIKINITGYILFMILHRKTGIVIYFRNKCIDRISSIRCIFLCNLLLDVLNRTLCPDLHIFSCRNLVILCGVICIPIRTVIL